MGKSIAPMLPLGEGKPQGLPLPVIVAMSFHRLFLGGLLSSRARLRFTGGQHFAISFPSSQIGWDQQPTKKEDVLNLVSSIARKCLTRPAVS